MRTWDAPDFYQPIAAPLHRCVEVLGVDLATVRADVGFDVGGRLADGTKVWGLMQLERQLRPEPFDRRRNPAADT